MPLKPPNLTAQSLEELRLQVNEALMEISSHVEQIYGIDNKQFKIQNDIDFNGFNATQVGTPESESSLVNKGYVDERTSSFTTISCSSGSNPVADQLNDTLTLIAGDGVIITGDSRDDSVTIGVDPFFIDPSKLIDRYGNIAIRALDAAEHSDNHITVQAGEGSYGPQIAAEGPGDNVNFVISPKGDASNIHLWGGGEGQYRGAHLGLYGRDHATLPGYVYLDFGGYDATGKIVVRRRGTSAFTTIYEIDSAGKLTHNYNAKLNGLSLAIAVKTASYTLTATDDIVVFNSPTAVLAYLPPATGSGKNYWIKNIGAGTATVFGDSAETLDAEASVTLDQDEAIHVVDYASGVWEVQYGAPHTHSEYLPFTVIDATGHYTGFPNRTDTSLSWADGTYTLTLTASSDTIYINGVAYSISTLTKQLSVAQEAASGLYWFWITAPLGVPQLNVDTASPGFDKCLVATVYWNTTTNKGILSDERHWMGRDQWMHEYLHETVGARYAYGMTGTFTDTTITIAEGEFYDEDIEHENSEETNCKVLYHDGSSAWAWDVLTTPYKVVAPGSDTNLRYNNGTALATVDNNKYANYWVFITPDVDEPVHVVIGTAQYTTIALARAAGVPSLGSLASAESKLIYKITYQNNGGSPDYIEATDYRSVSSLPSTSYVASDHGALAGLGDDDHPQYVTKALFDAQTILAATSDDTPAALTVAEQTLVGRITGGNIAALSASQVRTLINVADGATANTKASGTEVDAGSNDTKFVTPAAIYNSHNVPSVAPGTSGNLMTSDGTYWTSAAPSFVTKALYDAYSILYATTDNTPAALSVTEQTVVGRVTGGAIAALAIDSDLTSVSANNDTVPSAKATKAYADLMLPLTGGTLTGELIIDRDFSSNASPQQGLTIDMDDSGTNSGVIKALNIDISGIGAGTRYAGYLRGGNLDVRRDNSISFNFGTYHNTDTTCPHFYFYRGKGTEASKLKVDANCVLGQINFLGYEEVTPAHAEGAYISVISTEDWTSTANGSNISFYCVPETGIVMTKWLESTGDKIGLFGATPVAKGAALTAANSSALNTGDATSDTVIGNIRTRLGELEARIQSIGIIS